MCWETSKPGHTTSTMHEIAHPISKAELKEGDCLLFASEHVVLFGGWLNSDQSQYIFLSLNIFFIQFDLLLLVLFFLIEWYIKRMRRQDLVRAL